MQPGDRKAIRHARRERLQRLLDHEEGLHQPQWVRPSEGEPLWPVALAVVVAAGLQLAVPARLALHPRWLLPTLVLGLLIVLAAVKDDGVEGAVELAVAAAAEAVPDCLAAGGW